MGRTRSGSDARTADDIVEQAAKNKLESLRVMTDDALRRKLDGLRVEPGVIEAMRARRVAAEAIVARMHNQYETLKGKAGAKVSPTSLPKANVPH